MNVVIGPIVGVSLHYIYLSLSLSTVPPIYADQPFPVTVFLRLDYSGVMIIEGSEKTAASSRSIANDLVSGNVQIIKERNNILIFSYLYPRFMIYYFYVLQLT